MDFLIFTALQFILFVPFFIIWENDCRELGKDNLAASLEERFIAWMPSVQYGSYHFSLTKNKYYDILGLRGGAQDQPRKGVRALGRRANPSRTIL